MEVAYHCCWFSIQVEDVKYNFKCLVAPFFHIFPYSRIDTTEFATKVREYNKLAPFNFAESSFNIFNFSIYISIYAAHLYDSVLLYAKALDGMIRQKKERKEAYDINELARDGEFLRFLQCLDYFNFIYTLKVGK